MDGNVKADDHKKIQEELEGQLNETLKKLREV